MTAGKLAAALGKGLVAGAAGTAVMTVAQMIEMKINDREGSDAPLQAVETLFGLEVADEPTREALSNAIHWLYGTAWGGVRGLLGATGLGGGASTTAHFALVWGAALAMLPALGIGKPVHEQPPAQVAMDGGFHAVYAVAAGTVYELLERSDA